MMEQITYHWRNNAPVGADPQLIGECVAQLAKLLGRPFEMVTADDLVEAARDTAHPLHTYFQWDDATAGASWRRQQARMVLGGLRYSIVRNGTVAQVALGAVRVNGTHGYVPVTLIDHDAELSRQMRVSALAGLRAWQKRVEQFVKDVPGWDLIEAGAQLFEQAVAESEQEAFDLKAALDQAVADKQARDAKQVRPLRCTRDRVAAD